MGDSVPTWLALLLATPLVGLAVHRLVDRGTVVMTHTQYDRARVPSRFAIELAAIGVVAWAWWVDGDTPRCWFGAVLGWGLLALACIDWATYRLPDVLTLPLVLAGLGATAVLSPAELADHAVAAAAGYLAFRLVGLTYRRLRGREGLGGGDAKLLGAAGAWLGLEQLPVVVLVAAVMGIGLIVATSARLSRGTAIPFGPALALSTWLMWIWV